MADFLVAIGLFFAIEGVLFAAFPLRSKCAIATALDMPDVRLRIVGLGAGRRRHCLAGYGAESWRDETGTHFGSLFRPNPAPNCAARLVLVLRPV
jgi:uncharacterized protein